MLNRLLSRIRGRKSEIAPEPCCGPVEASDWYCIDRYSFAHWHGTNEQGKPTGGSAIIDQCDTATNIGHEDLPFGVEPVFGGTVVAVIPKKRSTSQPVSHIEFYKLKNRANKWR